MTTTSCICSWLVLSLPYSCKYDYSVQRRLMTQHYMLKLLIVLCIILLIGSNKLVKVVPKKVPLLPNSTKSSIRRPIQAPCLWKLITCRSNNLLVVQTRKAKVKPLLTILRHLERRSLVKPPSSLSRVFVVEKWATCDVTVEWSSTSWLVSLPRMLVGGTLVSTLLNNLYNSSSRLCSSWQ